MNTEVELKDLVQKIRLLVKLWMAVKGFAAHHPVSAEVTNLLQQLEQIP